MSALHRLAALAAATLLALGIYSAATRGIADVRYFEARSVLTRTAQEHRLPELAELEDVQASLGAAMSLEASNPMFVEQLARVHEMRALQLEARDPARREELRRSLEKFHTAALMRPASPYVWAAIANLKYRLDDMDFEFYGALQRAERYGRWEPAIQLELADLGLAAWPLLAEPAKLMTLDAIARALPRQGREIRRIAASHGTLARVCEEEVRLRKAPTGLCVRN
ncbi:MAG: hypothetical protein ACRET8_04945 [Burkholderiales bacterium]